MIKKFTAKRNCIGMDSGDIVDAVLNDRGIDDIQAWLHPSEEGMLPLDALKNIDKAYEMLDDAISMSSNILVLADVDVDGCTSAAIMVRYLEKCGANVECIINEGKAHGVDKFDLDLLEDIDLLIIVDSLNNDPSCYKRILDTGVQLLVLDHHIVEDKLLNANLPFVLISSAYNYDNPELSGAGVVLKFCLYCDDMNLTDYTDDLWVYAAMGIVADMCSMAVPENRYIVSKGLAQYENPAVKKMVGTYLFNTESIQFSIAPLINAAMRMGQNDKAMSLFLTDDESDINDLVKELKKCKEGQNACVDEMMPDLLAQGEKQLDRKCMFFFIDNIEEEVTGLIGNRLLSEYQRPLFILHEGEKQYCGSMRAVGVENFLEMANSIGKCLCQGHPNAAGAFIDKDKFDAFKEEIEVVLKDVEFRCDVEADIEITPSQIDDQLIKNLGMINRISGSGFSPITVLIKKDNYEVSFMSKGKHSKYIDNDTGVIFVKWNDKTHETAPTDAELVGVGKISSAYYGRTKYLQLVMDNYDFNSTK